MHKNTLLALALVTGTGLAGLMASGAIAAGPPDAPPPTAQTRMDGEHGSRARAPMTEEDRAAFFDSRIAGLKAGLKLTPEQEKLWPPVETALRDAGQAMAANMDKMRKAGPPADPLDGLRRMADMSTQRGAALAKLADAATPLNATLSEAQKHRLPALLHDLRPRGMDHMAMMDHEGHYGRRAEGEEGRADQPRHWWNWR